jgi:hypothetical protein
MEKITIRNEEDAIALLKKLVEGYEMEEVTSLEFESWPKFVIRIKGVDFDGTIPTRIMPTLLDLQREVHRVYCLSTYGDENLRRLTKKDREQLELVVKVDKGSSLFETLLKDPILKTLQDAASRMTPEQLTVTIIIFSLSVTSVLFWKLWLNKRIKERELDQTVQLSRLEKEKMEVIQRAMQRYPSSQVASEGVGEVRSELLTRLKPSDNLEIGTSEPSAPEAPPPIHISGEEAVQYTHTQRERAVEKMITGEFFLKTADFSKPEGVRLEVERVADSYSFRADVPLGVLGHEQAEALKNNSWSKTNVEMSLLVKELHGRYTSAKVVSVKSEE